MRKGKALGYVTAFLILVLMAGPLASQASGPSHTVTTIAGRNAIGDRGPATAAILVSVSDVKVDANGNLHIADLGAARVQMVSAARGLISAVAGDGRRVSDGDGDPPARPG